MREAVHRLTCLEEILLCLVQGYDEQGEERDFRPWLKVVQCRDRAPPVAEAYGRLERDYWKVVRDNQDLQTRAAQRPIAGALQEGHPDARRLQPGKLEKIVRSPLNVHRP